MRIKLRHLFVCYKINNKEYKKKYRAKGPSARTTSS